MEIRLICRGQELFRDPEDKQEIVAGSRGLLTARITYEDDTLWKGLARIVLWSNSPTCVGTVETDGTVTVPWEALREGKLRVSISGVGDGGKRRLVTKEMAEPLTVLPCGAAAGQEAQEPTPAVSEVLTAMVAQALEQLDGVGQALTEAREAAAAAQTAKEEAERILEALRKAQGGQETTPDVDSGQEDVPVPDGQETAPEGPTEDTPDEE